MKKSRTDYPVRTCLVCGTKAKKSDLVRYVLDGELVMDVRQNIQSRGVYVCHNEKCIETGLKKKKLLRSLQGIEFRKLNRKTG